MSEMAKAAGARPFFWYPPRVSERTVRLAAAFSVAALGLAWLLGLPWLVLGLGLDFLLRFLAGARLSPVARTAFLLVRGLGGSGRQVAGAPKQLAALVGGVVLLAAGVLLYLDGESVGWALTGMVAVFAFLEAAFGFCVVCKIYARFVECPDCDGASDATYGLGGDGI